MESINVIHVCVYLHSFQTVDKCYIIYLNLYQINIRIAFFHAIYEDLVDAAFAGWNELRLQAFNSLKSPQTSTIPKERF